LRGEDDDDDDAGKKNDERRRKMRVTEMNIVRMICPKEEKERRRPIVGFPVGLKSDWLVERPVGRLEGNQVEKSVVKSRYL
jgi:hypothetical protein